MDQIVYFFHYSSVRKIEVISLSYSTLVLFLLLSFPPTPFMSQQFSSGLSVYLHKQT